MTKISSTSSVSKGRIHNSFVHRNKSVNRAASVEAVNSVNPISNNTNYSSSNHLMSSDAFYDKLEELKREYLNFYHHERNLEKTIVEIKEDEYSHIEHMKDLIDKYNRAILALSSLDKHLNTNHTDRIKSILWEYTRHLNAIGLYIVRDKELEINEEIFNNNLIDSKDNIIALFRPIKSMILTLYKGFKNIKGPKEETLEQKYQNFNNLHYSGILLDKKS